MSRKTTIHLTSLLGVLWTLASCAATPPAPSTSRAEAMKAADDPCQVHECVPNMDNVLEAARDLGKKHGIENVLVVYDIDNTLLTSSTQLGSDQWFNWYNEDLPEGDPERINVKADFQCLLEAQELLYFTRPMNFTDKTVPSTVDALRKDGFTQWVITSRGPEVSAVTFREFRRRGLEFSRFPGEGAFVQSDSQRQHGVFFTSGGHKGQVLEAAVKDFGIDGRIKGIVFVDDTEKHVKRIKDVFATKLDLHAYLYRAVESDVQKFRNDASVRSEAKRQWCALVPTIGDVEQNFSTAVIDLVHTHKDTGVKHSLSQCLINTCVP